MPGVPVGNSIPRTFIDVALETELAFEMKLDQFGETEARCDSGVLEILVVALGFEPPELKIRQASSRARFAKDGWQRPSRTHTTARTRCSTRRLCITSRLTLRTSRCCLDFTAKVAKDSQRAAKECKASCTSTELSGFLFHCLRFCLNMPSVTSESVPEVSML